jgi:tetratricopeptide (TPR) repeat protein/predicted Ser/Thr protein kinase
MPDTAVLGAGSDFGPRYRIECLVGQGGMGRVYKAWDQGLDRVVAIKVVRPGAMSDTEALKRFKQELLLASKISHKNILRIHDMGEVGDVKFISMAYVEGPNLHQFLQENPKLPFERIVSFAQQLAEALAAAHAEGVVHRDLKPQNILVAKDDRVYVTDFGLAKSFQDEDIGMTRAGAFLGTPRYMSPEQVEGKTADHRSDLYAYGLVLYEMVTGDVPFTGESTLKVMYQRIHESPKSPKLFNPDLPDWFVRVIMRCLEKTPASRYQSAREILADLQGAGASVAAPGATRTVGIELPEFAERPWAWAMAAALGILILAFAIPPVRHRILGAERAKTGSLASGIPPLERGKFVAVLPFRVLGDVQSLDHVAEGLNEALSAKLFQLKDLHLTSDPAAKVSDKEPLEKAGRALGANLLVTGVVQGSADNMRIIVNLDDVSEGKRTWSQEFSGVSKDLLSIEDQISAQLVTALALKPTNEEMARSAERPTDNVEAYDLYLRGRQSLRGPDSVKAPQKSIDYFQQAIQKDPEFALAYAGLADASVAIYMNTKDGFWAQKAVGAAERAEQLKDDVPEVHFSLGFVYQQTGKTAQAIAELKRGLQLAPNSDAGYRRLGNAYLDSGQKEEAIAAYKKGIGVNPYYWVLHIELGRAYFSIGQNEKALGEFKRVTELEPENVTGWDDLAGAYERMGRYQESIPAYRKSIELAPTWLAYSNLGYVYTVLKQYPQAIQALEKSVELGPYQELPVGNLADAYRYSGQKDKADVIYDKAIALAFQELQVNPQSTNAMGDLAEYYAKKGEPMRASEFIRRARGIDKKDVELIFSQATVENLASQPSDSIRTLRDALSKGYPVQEVESNPDFDNLKSRPEFQALVKEFRQPAK